MSTQTVQGSTESTQSLANSVFRELPAATTPRQGRSAADRETARQMLALLKQGADLRPRKVRRIRAAIHSSKFENDLKLDVAVDRLLSDLRDPAL